MRRIYCLYRGIDGADIQRQQEECRKYANEHGWFIFKEFCEFVDNARDNTDALIDLSNAAQKSKFDILLVAEYQNIGRIEEETPIAVFCLEKMVLRLSVQNLRVKTLSNKADLCMKTMKLEQA